MLQLRMTGFRTTSRDGVLEFSLKDEYDRWGAYQRIAPEIGIDKPVEMNAHRDVVRARSRLERAQRQHLLIWREAALADRYSRFGILEGHEEQVRFEQRVAH